MNLIIAILLGVVAGWLVNYLSDVLPTQRRLSRPVCNQCGTVFHWQDYFILRTCPECKQARTWRTYIVLIAAMVLSAVVWVSSPPQFGYWFSLLVLTYFGVVFVIDVEHRLILHMVSIVGAVIGLIAGIASNGLTNTLIGGLAGLGIMLLFYLFGVLFARYRARKLGVNDDEEALGFGDVILAGVIGLMVGWPHILIGLLVAILAGGVISLLIIIVLSALKRFESMNVFTAYGPYLILGATLLMFFPQALWFLPIR